MGMGDRRRESKTTTERVARDGGARNSGGVQSLDEAFREIVWRDGTRFAVAREVGEEDLDLGAEALEFLGEGKPIAASAEKAVEADEGGAAFGTEGLEFQGFHFHSRCAMRRVISR